MKKAHHVPYPYLFLSIVISAGILIFSIYFIDDLTIQKIYSKLLFPLLRLLFFISIGLLVGQVIESTGWTRYLGALAAPIFKFGNLSQNSIWGLSRLISTSVSSDTSPADPRRQKKAGESSRNATNIGIARIYISSMIGK